MASTSRGAAIRALILPGLHDSGPDHWQTLWEQGDATFVRLVKRDWETPIRQEWVGTLETAVGCTGDGVVLVAHSAGCALAAFWGAATPIHVRGALLVAPADTEAESYPVGPTGWQPLPRVRLPFPSIVVASTNDEFVTLDRARAFADSWGSRFVDVGAVGHINADSGLGCWPFGRDLLRELLE
jgi:uncharacterized protein